MVDVRKATAIRALVRRWLRDESGAAAVEYALIVALVGVATSTAFYSLGQTISGIFGDIADALERVNIQIR